jgi:hypothetical protein
VVTPTVRRPDSPNCDPAEPAEQMHVQGYLRRSALGRSSA